MLADTVLQEESNIINIEKNSDIITRQIYPVILPKSPSHKSSVYLACMLYHIFKSREDLEQSYCRHQ